MASNNWYVLTGGPSTGKTTLLSKLEKLGYTTIPETARTLIDEAVDRGVTVAELRANEKRFQEEVARLKAKLELNHEPSVLTFLDRGMHDTMAYMRHYGFTIENWIQELMEKATYRKVFLLEPLPGYEQDYARTEDRNFVSHIQELLYNAYAEFGMAPIRIKAADPDERVRMILDKVKEGQPA